MAVYTRICPAWFCRPARCAAGRLGRNIPGGSEITRHKTLRNAGRPINALAWNGERLAMGSENGIIALIDGTTLQQTGAVMALAWHENILVSGSPDGALTHTLLAVRHDHTARINSLVWQGSRLASVSGENFEGSKLILWDTIMPSMIVGGTADMLQAAWQGDRVAVLSADHLIRTWNAGTGGRSLPFRDIWAALIPSRGVPMDMK